MDDEVVGIDLVDGGEEDVEVDGRGGVAGGEGEEGEQHGEVQFDVFIYEAVFGFHGVEVVVSQDIEEGEERTVDPSSPLLHQILVGFHGICLGDGIWNVFQVIFLFCLAVDAQRENTILCQVHVGLSVIFLFHFRVQDQLEVTVFQQIRLVGLRFD